MDRIFLTKTKHEESRNPYNVVLYNLLEYKPSKHNKPVEITHYFEDWQYPTQQEVEYFHLIFGKESLIAYEDYLDRLKVFKECVILW